MLRRLGPFILDPRTPRGPLAGGLRAGCGFDSEPCGAAGGADSAKLANVLVLRGARLASVDADGNTPLDVAKMVGRQVELTATGREKIVDDGTGGDGGEAFERALAAATAEDADGNVAFGPGEFDFTAEVEDIVDTDTVTRQVIPISLAGARPACSTA
jgi:hypothetical protein